MNEDVPEDFYFGMKPSNMNISKRFLFLSSSAWLLMVQAAAVFLNRLWQSVLERFPACRWLYAMKSGLVRKLNVRNESRK